MFTFGPASYVILLTVLLLCLAASIFFIKRMKQRLSSQTKLFYKRSGLFASLVGVILLLLSITGYLKMQADILKSPVFIRPVAEMTAEPIFILLISGVLIGLTSLVIGLIYLQSSFSPTRV